MQWIADRKTEGVLYLDELCTKTGKWVMEVLRTKHPDAHLLYTASLDTYIDRTPDLVPVDINKDTLTEVAGQLCGCAGMGGTESASLQHWLLRFGAAIRKLRLTVTYFTECIGNRRPPWVNYQALTSGQLIALDKPPGIMPVGVVETELRLMEKSALRVTWQEAKAACGTDQMSGGV